MSMVAAISFKFSPGRQIAEKSQLERFFASKAWMHGLSDQPLYPYPWHSEFFPHMKSACAKI
jgi:hypothetical protein